MFSAAIIIILLQTALALLTAVQAHPELPQIVKANATEVAQQAITQATIALTSQPLGPALPSAISQTTSSTKSPAGWNRYTNSQYGFSIQYPNDMLPTISDPPVAGPSPDPSVPPLKLVVQFGTDWDGFSVSASANTSDLAACSNATPLGDSNWRRESATIGGTSFTLYDWSEGGLIHRNRLMYRKAQGGVCFAVTSSQTYSAGDDDAKYTARMKLLDAIIQTFRFTSL